MYVNQVTGVSGKGSCSGSGAFDFAAANGFGIDVKVAADRAVLIDRDDIGATVTGPLRFVSDGSGGTISRDVAVTESRYRLGRATAAPSVPQLHINEIKLPRGGTGEHTTPRHRRRES